MITAGFRSWVEVSCEQIAANFHAVRKTVGGGVQVMPVVKADAYHHGAVEVSRILEAEGARWLAVSSVEEGVALRQAGIRARILVMAGYLPGEREALFDNRLTPAVHALSELRQLERLAARRNSHLAYHLKIDTGMGRLGTRAAPAEIISAARSAPHLVLEGLMTHFASAALYTSDQTEHQIEAYHRIRRSLLAAGISPPYSHLAATIPIAYGRREAWGNMVRPGHAIYGYVSPVRGQAPPNKLDVHPALEWKASIVDIKEVPPGTPIGYGGMFQTRRRTRVGILAVGYADGFPHRLSNRGNVIAAGCLAPILGAVSMDLTAVDLTEAPGLNVGDAVTLLGRHGDIRIDAQQIARTAGTISYSVLCSISPRVKRIYL